jgi:hypothetical protein
MFSKKTKARIQFRTAVIYNLLAAMFPTEEWNKSDLRRFAKGVAIAMDGARNFNQFEQIYGQIDSTVLYLRGPAAFQKHIRELLREAKKQHF